MSESTSVDKIGGVSRALFADAMAEERAEQAQDRFDRYLNQLVIAQTSHDPWEWMKAGSLFKQYAEAAVAADLCARRDAAEAAEAGAA